MPRALFVSLMVDKVAIPIELGANFTRAISDIRSEVRAGRPSVPSAVAPNKDFLAKVDLRKLTGADALLFVQARHGRHNDKLEILNTGDKSRDDIEEIVESVVSDDPARLRVSRLDLCADTGTPVDWFAKSVRCQYKRWRAEVGEIELLDEKRESMQFMDIGKRRLETMYLGKQPNPLRVYDKTAESFHRYRRDEREHYRVAMELDSSKAMMKAVHLKHAAEAHVAAGIDGLTTVERNILQFLSPDGDPKWSDEHRARLKRIGLVKDSAADLPRVDDPKIRKEARDAVKALHPFMSFYDWTGGKLWEWTTLTRIERQMVGRLPVLLSTWGGVRSNVLDFNPFERVTFAAPNYGPTWADVDGLTPMEQLAGGMIWHLLTEEGWTYDQVYKFLSRGSNGKRSGSVKKRIEKLQPFFAKALYPADGEKGISAAELFETYRDSIKKQFNLAA